MLFSFSTAVEKIAADGLGKVAAAHAEVTAAHIKVGEDGAAAVLEVVTAINKASTAISEASTAIHFLGAGVAGLGVVVWAHVLLRGRRYITKLTVDKICEVVKKIGNQLITAVVGLAGSVYAHLGSDGCADPHYRRT